MSKLGQIVMKNFRELIDNKLSLFILILGPLIIISLLGIYYYSDNSHSINLGIYGNNESKLMPIYVQGFKDNGFNVINYDSVLGCEDAIKIGIVHACVIFPNDFKLANNQTNIIKVEVDESKGKVVNLLEHSIYITIETQNQKIQLEQTNMLIDSVEKTEKTVKLWQENLSQANLVVLKLEKNNEKIKQNILQIETIYNYDDLNIGDISTGVNKVNGSVNSAINSSLTLVLEIKSDIANITSVLDNGNVTGSDIIKIETLTKDTKSTISSLETKLSSLSKDKYEINKLVKELSDLQLELSDLESQLNTKYNLIKTDLGNVTREQTNLGNILNDINVSTVILLNDLNKIEIRDSVVLVKPVSVEVSNVSTKADNKLTAIFPALIASLIMIISLFIASTFILQDRKSEANFRNYMSQTSGFLFLIGNFLSIFLIVFLQMSIIILVYYLIFLKVSFLKALLVILIIIPIISFFVILGMFIGNVSKSETVNSIFLFVLIFCFLTFSGILMPIESLSYLMQKLSMLNPYIISEGILRKLIVMESFIKKGKLFHYYVYMKLKTKENISNMFEFIKSKLNKKNKKEI